MTDTMDPAKLQIVIALFEREYPEERIKKAIRHCNSVDSAIEWLEKEQPSAAPAPARAGSRRLNRKSAEALPTTTRPVLEEQPAAPQSDSKVSSHASPVSSESSAAAAPAASAPVEAPAAVVEPQAAAPAAVEPDTRAVVSEGVEPAAVKADVAEPVVAMDAGVVDTASSCPGECQAAAIVISSAQIPFLEIRPMQPDIAADYWAKARGRWPQIRQDLLDQAAGVPKRPASSETGEASARTPTKKPRNGYESPPSRLNTSNARPPATPQGSGGSASASAAQIGGGGEEAAASSEEASATKAPSPESSSARNVRMGQFASRSAAVLRSPLPTDKGKVSNRRGSWTPGTSPRAQMKHNSSSEMCEICCCDVDRGAAVRLGCSHGWYCFDCMTRHAEARLEVGAAHVACPECSASIAECNLRKILPSELIDRLLTRSLEQAISSTADLWACPTPNCPMRVALEEGEEPRLQCTECKKESCLRCGSQPYHKGATCEEYAESRRNKGRKKAEKEQAKAEDSFRQWMQETGTKQCPTCSMAVTKQNLDAQEMQYQECHKMVCRNCNTRFCFKCLKILTETFTCGCSIDRHGFVDPKTGKRLEHLRPVKVSKLVKPAAKNKAGR